ncbi:hypothetical protein AB0B45_49120 [Nonomuraea sp. NPDC049152]|uniref:hypothetical protein n=1 Tax=Nonomuraea sp. NPDC049152 TaxID=3154350 RepID=UPI0033E7676B
MVALWREPDGTSRSVPAGAASIANGKIITVRDYCDQLEVYSQLGFSLLAEAMPDIASMGGTALPRTDERRLNGIVWKVGL